MVEPFLKIAAFNPRLKRSNPGDGFGDKTFDYKNSRGNHDDSDNGGRQKCCNVGICDLPFKPGMDACEKDRQRQPSGDRAQEWLGDVDAQNHAKDAGNGDCVASRLAVVGWSGCFCHDATVQPDQAPKARGWR